MAIAYAKQITRLFFCITIVLEKLRLNVTTKCIPPVAVIIVGFRNPSDIIDCLFALSNEAPDPSFDVLICENGGTLSFRRLVDELLSVEGPCEATDDPVCSPAVFCPRFSDIRRLQLRGRASVVWVACASENLGYAGGINVCLEALNTFSGWNGVWILNPDTQPQRGALAALLARAHAGNKGMVGSTILSPESVNKIHCRGGLHWQKWIPRTISLGHGDPINGPHHLAAIEAQMDCPSGASMYITRECLKRIGPMDESYFLFFEDLDWGLRAKPCGLGYASNSIVAHKRGTTTGSARQAAMIPQISVYLQHRNAIHFVRKHYPWTLPMCVFLLLLYAVQYWVRGARRNFRVALKGILAGLKGEIGRPEGIAY